MDKTFVFKDSLFALDVHSVFRLIRIGKSTAWRLGTKEAVSELGYDLEFITPEEVHEVGVYRGDLHFTYSQSSYWMGDDSDLDITVSNITKLEI